jgi:D-alanyl-D-alanine carboxypeptidase
MLAAICLAVFTACFNLAPLESGDFLLLVSRDHPLCESYAPHDLVKHGDTQMRAAVLEAYTEMEAAMLADGVTGLKIVSGYRSYEKQNKIFQAKLRNVGCFEKAAEVVQPPGCSEHQTGLALDVTIDGALSQAFAQTEAGRWLADNCHSFGFIIRYPRGKSYVTDVVYEPWHLRFVGQPHASNMHFRGLTLEEYLTNLLHSCNIFVISVEKGGYLYGD